MFHRIIHGLFNPIPGHGKDPGMPYADITPVRQAPVIHGGFRRG